MKEISKSNFLSLGQTTGILNLPSSVVATPARKVLSGKVNKRTAAYPHRLLRILINNTSGKASFAGLCINSHT